ncbi:MULTISPECIES: AAA family ATPase [Kitasatospora]|uniref:AAA family ATPase n=1 Tax=Kitasatospora cathayae TaxID=3004092 RepID=A0ABY7QFG4_9ACTN|nr:AAA family ATPase [Kitasatospora sp. HUAS 3-15]WBP90984.1 AAA family ATPase [Kitasatospora sp. HUAS 3-15]
MHTDHRPWDVLLIGGASGLGKSRAAAHLAAASGAFTVEFDDVVAALQAATTPRTHPGLHHFSVTPARGLDTERVLQLQIATAHALDEALLGVVRNRLSVDVPAIVEGDYLSPRAAARAAAEAAAQGRRVRAVFLHEGDAARISANYARREPGCGPQRERAAVSARYSSWLAAQARAHRLPVVDCLPYDTLPHRLTAAWA